jgi:uncharacterized iron-regulated membrane protein
VHGWIAAIVGVPFVLVGVSGSFLVFYTTIDAWLNPELARRRAQGPPLSLDRIAAIATARFPGSSSISIEPPRGAFDVYTVWAEEGDEQADGVRSIRLSVDPATGEMLGESEWGRSLVSLVYEFHYTLLLGEAGRVAIAASGLAMFASFVSGLVLWWPGRRKLGKALKIRLDGSRHRLTYDIHRTAGFYSALVLAVVAFSGIYLIYPFLVVPVVRMFSPVRDWPESHRVPVPQGAPSMSLDRAAALALARHPGAKLVAIEVPAAPHEPLRVDLREPSDLREYGSTSLWLDPRSGEVVDVIEPRTRTAGETLLDWMFPLHNGEAFGLVGRWIVFASGLALPALGLTGLLLWRRRRGAEGRRRAPLAPESRIV